MREATAGLQRREARNFDSDRVLPQSGDTTMLIVDPYLQAMSAVTTVWCTDSARRRIVGAMLLANASLQR